MMNQDFNFLRDTVKQAAGITFAVDKAYLVESRLAPVLQKFKLQSIAELCNLLRKNVNRAVLNAVIDALTINETSFFRDGRPYETLRKIVLPEIIKTNSASKSLRIWCAAASTGQEPYSIAMTLAEEKANLPAWRLSILGTDISPTVIERAKLGRYSSFEINRGLPEPLRSRYLDQSNDYWTVKAALRGLTRFEEHNLMDDASRLGVFDVVFCRNVLIYFDLPTKRKVLDQIYRRLQPRGFLFLGAAETVLGISEQFKSVPGASGLYRAVHADAGDKSPEAKSTEASKTGKVILAA